jgi:hypothetical protein
MPLYLVEEAGAPWRLVNAKSEAAAIAHVTAPRFKASIITNPSAAAVIVADGTPMEIAGQPVAAVQPNPEAEPAPVEHGEQTDGAKPEWMKQAVTQNETAIAAE